jgi:hypothetical protein
VSFIEQSTRLPSISSKRYRRTQVTDAYSAPIQPSVLRELHIQAQLDELLEQGPLYSRTINLIQKVHCVKSLPGREMKSSKGVKR